MEFTMGGIFNATQEIAAMQEYPNIRMHYVAHMTSDTPNEDLISVHFDFGHKYDFRQCRLTLKWHAAFENYCLCSM